MEQKERLIELIKKAETEFANSNRPVLDIEEFVADFILANGIIVPPVKINQKIWLVFTPKYPANPEDKGKYFVREDGVQRIIYGAKGLSIETWNMGTIPTKELGTKLFLTEEEAEREIERRKK